MTASASGSVLDAIGNTPLARLRRMAPPGSAEVWVKLEGANPTGSYKDRMAVSRLVRAVERGELRPGDRIVEYTGGSTGAALAFVSGVLGLRFVAVGSDAFAASKLRAMRVFGAELIVEPSHGGGITPELAQRMKARAHAVAAEGAVYVDQFGHPDVRAGYAPMGREIAEALDGRVDAFCAGVGTGAALMGALDGMAAAGVSPAVHALEPAESPFFTEGRAGAHRVEGVALGMEPPFLERDRVTAFRAVPQETAFETCRRLAAEEGLLCGGSGGLAVAAALEVARDLGPGRRVVALACDTGLKYLDGPIFAGV